jgi:hypothetical protein
MTDYLDLAKSVCVEPRLLAEKLERQAHYPTPDEMDAMAEGCERGISLLGRDNFMAGALRAYAEHLRAEEALRCANEP